MISVDNAATTELWATTETVPMTAAVREPRCRKFERRRRSLWVLTDALTHVASGWVSLRRYHGGLAQTAMGGLAMFGGPCG